MGAANIGRYIGHVQLYPSMAIRRRFPSHAPGVPAAASGTAICSNSIFSGAAPSRSRGCEIAAVVGSAHSLWVVTAHSLWVGTAHLMPCPHELQARSQPPHQLLVAVTEDRPRHHDIPRHEQAGDGAAAPGGRFPSVSRRSHPSAPDGSAHRSQSGRSAVHCCRLPAGRSLLHPPRRR